jgi:gliding motility-associated-like protein
MNLLSIHRTKCKFINEITDFCYKSILLNFNFNPCRVHVAFKKALKLFFLNLMMFSLIGSIDAKSNTHREEPVFFINNGQWSNQVLAKAQLNVGDFWITRHGFVFNFLDTLAAELLHERTIQNLKINTQAVFIDFLNCNPNMLVIGTGKQSSEYYNFYRGKQTKPITGVKKFSGITVQNVWPGIDLEVTSYNGTIKYNWVVAPQADLQKLQWKYRGQTNIQPLPNQKCRLKTQWYEWVESIPSVYWTNADGSSVKNSTAPEVSYQFELNQIERSNSEKLDLSMGFRFVNLPSTRTKTLVIDPILVFSTYTGSRADNFGCTGTYDEQGNGYAGGTVFDIGLPVTPGAAQTNFGDGVDEDLGYGGSRDAAILKFNKTGNQLIYCTYLGGSNNDQPHSMVTDSSENLYVMGSTRSFDFPVSSNAYDRSINGDYDFFITKFNATGSTMVGTFVGGGGLDAVGADRSATPVDDFPLIYNYADEFRGEIITDQKNVYISGVTYSLNFPKTGNTPFAGKSDGVVFCLNKDLTTLKWSQEFGGTGYDAFYGLALGKSSDLYVSGGSSSTDLKTTAGSNWINGYNGGIADAILLRLDLVNGSLLQGRYHGTNLYEQAHFVQTGQSGKPYIYGQTEANMPNVNARFYQAGGGQFITTYSTNLANIDMQTTFGYNGNNTIMPNISPSAFLVDRCERIFVSGWGGATNSALYDVNTGAAKTHRNKGRTTGLQTTTDAAQKVTDGSDFYIAVFSKNFYSLAYATFFGGVSSPGKPAEEHVDGGTSRFDAKGIIYQSVCAGCRRNGLFPVTPTAYSRTMNSDNCNNALFKIDFENLNLKPRLKDTFVQVIATQPILFQLNGVDPDPFDTMYFVTKWLKKGGMKGSDTAKITVVPGIGKASLIVNWPTQCGSYSKDTAELFVYVMDRGCPKADTTYARIKILVTEPPKVIPPEAICVSFDRQTAKMSIAWDNITVPTGFFKYFLLRRTNPDGTIKILDTIRANTASSFIDANVVNPRVNNYCYELIGVNICDVQVFAKNVFCTVKELNTPITGVPLYTTTIVDDRYAEIRWAKSDEPDFKEFELYRVPRGGKFGSVPLAILTDTFYRDSSFDVDNISNCYQIMVVDQCGHVSKGSNEGCNVVIGGTATEAPYYYFDLNWQDYQGWSDGVKDWKLERKDDDHPFITIAPSLILRDYRDNQLDYDYGGYMYRVTAQRNAVKVPEQSYSESNWIYLIQPPEVWVPSGITKNGDGRNEVWGTFPLFVKEYDMKVFNRYGEKIWESANKKFQWDCIYQNEDIPDGVYAWYLEFKGWDKKTYRKTGTVTVLH